MDDVKLEGPTSDYWTKWKENKDQEAGNYLVSQYFTLVEYVVNRMAIGLPHSVQRDDLISFGSHGLLDAFDKFDTERGLKFETYASWRIKGAIIDGLRKTDWLPRSVRDKARKIEEAYAKLEQETLRAVTDKEVSAFLGMDEEEINRVLQDTTISSLMSIDEPIYDEEDHQTGRFNMIENEHADKPEEYIHKQYLKDTLATGINKLPEKEKLVVSLFYYEELNLTEIAEVLELSTSRISQLHSKAILRLKNALHQEQELMKLV
ncbi:FliA/WhiG family RNA polymerase sigma factor [Caldalkalibacillus salinus]|uniref:FliA/WhiG family RNA polymerase sigma factor n=1 Tax=Caldalkalibacillus salinus TaxID=2803787 RepID=UPI001920AACD|nr:FliA/WhiG family RNA polymerase sigma factor [Caldalkalibacillus salinus]